MKTLSLNLILNHENDAIHHDFLSQACYLVCELTRTDWVSPAFQRG